MHHYKYVDLKISFASSRSSKDEVVEADEAEGQAENQATEGLGGLLLFVWLKNVWRRLAIFEWITVKHWQLASIFEWITVKLWQLAYILKSEASF